MLIKLRAFFVKFIQIMMIKITEVINYILIIEKNNIKKNNKISVVEE